MNTTHLNAPFPARGSYHLGASGLLLFNRAEHGEIPRRHREWKRGRRTEDTGETEDTEVKTPYDVFRLAFSFVEQKSTELTFPSALQICVFCAICGYFSFRVEALG